MTIPDTIDADRIYWDAQYKEIKAIVDDNIKIGKIRKIYCIGDCLTVGIDSENNYGYPYFLQIFLGEKYKVINLGRTMLKLEHLIKFQNLLTPKNVHSSDIACVWCGTNDLYFDADIEIVIKNYNDYCKLLQNLNIKVVAVTILPRSLDAAATFETNRQIFNKFVKDNYEYVANIGDNKIIGQRDQETNPRFYVQPNNNHITSMGHRVVAKTVEKTIKSLIKKEKEKHGRI